LVDHVRTLYFDGVDQDMGLLGDLEHCRARLRNIVSELRPWRVLLGSTFGGLVPHAQRSEICCSSTFTSTRCAAADG
jgi:hypothetical protein